MKVHPELIGLLLIWSFNPQFVAAQRTIRLTSPDANIKCAFRVSDNEIQYSVLYKNKPLVESSTINLQFGGDQSQQVLRLGKPVFRDTTEHYELITGKASSVQSVYREARIPVSFGRTFNKELILIVRAFNDALAWRYVFNGPLGDSLSLTDERTEFNLSGNPTVKTLLLPNYTSSHEGLYRTMPYSDLPQDTLMDMPTLFEFPGNTYLAITEAALLDYAGMYLMKHNHTLRSMLSPLPFQSQIKVKATYPHSSPWRVLMISNRIGALIESNVLTTLNEPCTFPDQGWVKPGKTTFPWWNGNVLPDTINAPGMNFVTQQYYIDFCARNNIEYHTVVEYGLHQWYVDDGIGFQPGPHADVTTPVPGLNMKEICDYATSKGVGIRVWVHWAALYPKLDTAFALFEKWGIKGMMVDFMDRDDQQMVNIQTEILQKAAKHHLHIQFHGAYKPTGLSRTYPNEFTREGTLNYENNKWSKVINPDHDLNILFTRMLAGSTDYHLGGFRSVNDSAFRPQYTRPLIIGTRCHMLALYVVMENNLGMVCDYPEAYEGQPGFDFIKKVPTTWDQTKVIAAKVNEYLIIARRKKDKWYLGAVGNHNKHSISVPLDFLGEGNYTAEINADAPETLKDPNRLAQRNRTVNNNDKIDLTLEVNGGAAIIFSK